MANRIGVISKLCRCLFLAAGLLGVAVVRSFWFVSWVNSLSS